MTPRRQLFDPNLYPGYVACTVEVWDDVRAPPTMGWTCFRLRRQREVVLPLDDMLFLYVASGSRNGSDAAGRAAEDSPVLHAVLSIMELCG